MKSNQAPINVNFHHVVAAQIYTDDRKVREFYLSELREHLSTADTNKLPAVRLNFNLKHASGNKLPGYTRYSHKLLARWQYKIQLSKDVIGIDVLGNQIAAPMVHHMLLHHSLRYLAAFQGILMLHAGAVVKNGRSIIITGRGGAGKTTTTSNVLAYGDKNWKIHADDYVFLVPKPNSLAYLTRAHLYRDLISWVPEIRQRLTTRELIGLQFFGTIRKLSSDRLKWAVRLPLRRLWPDHEFEMSAVPASIVILERCDSPHPEVERISSTANLIDELIEMNFYEARHFIELIKLSHSVPDINSWINEWRSMEYKLLSQVLEQVPAYLLKLPKHTDRSPYQHQEILHILNGFVTDR